MRKLSTTPPPARSTRHLAAFLPVCFLALTFSGTAFAVDVFVSNEQEYLAALANPNATRIILTSNVSLDNVTTAPPIRVQSVVSLEGQADAYGVSPILDGKHGTRVLNNYFQGTIVDVNSIRNIIIQNGATQTSLSQVNGGAMYIHERLLNGIHNAMFFNNYAVTTGGALSIAYRNLDVDGIQGGIHNSVFSGNAVTGLNSLGGALYVNGTIWGGINYSTFSDNHAGGDGGAIRTRNFDGDVQSSIFEGNTAKVNGGAIWVDDVSKNWIGSIYNSVFTNNRAETGFAGAIDTTTLAGIIDNTRFVGNSAALAGGAVLVGTVDGISNSLFLDNKVQGRAFDYAAGQGAAISLDETVTLTDNVFLNNAASSLNSDALDSGFGGALFHHEASTVSVDVNVAASADNKTLFYGNTQNPYASGETPNSIHFANALGAGNDLKTNLNIQADGRVLMLDPLSAQKDGLTVAGSGAAYGNLETAVNKTGSGDWFLGGVSEMRGASTWNIDAGSLTLTTVDYGGSLGELGAAVDLSHGATAIFNLNAGGTLAGSGDITAKDITLDGTINPEKWVNTGVKAPDIVAATEAIIDSVTADVMADSAILDTDKLKIINQRVLAQTKALVDVARVSDFGTLNLSGNVTLAANSTTILDVSPNANLSDRINIDGNLTIASGATIDIRNTAGNWALNTPYTLIETTGIIISSFADNDTTFSGFDSYLFADPTLVHTSTQVQLLMQRNDTPFASICETHNQCAVAGAADTLPDSHGVVEALALLGGDEARRAYDNLSGEIYASTRAVILDNRQLRDAVTNRTRQLGAEKFWSTAWGFDGRMKGKYGIATIDHSSGGLAVGADISLGSTTVGAVFGYENDTIKNGAGRNSRAELDSYSIGTYLASEVAGVKLSAGMLYSHIDINTTRTIWVPRLEGTVKADHSADKVQLFTEIAKDFTFGAATLTPYAGVAQIWLKSDAVRERASDAASAARLHIEGGTDSVTQTTLGMRAAYQLVTTLPVTLSGDLGWSYAAGDVDNETRHRFADTSTPYTIRGTGIDKNTALVGAGAQVQLGANARLSLNYQGEFGDKRQIHAVSVQLKAGF